MILWAIAIVTILVGYYAVWGRECMKRKAWSKPLFDRIEPIEIALWRKSETLLWARFKMLAAFLLTLLSTVGAIDVTPFIAFIPERHRWWVVALPPAALALDGVIQEIQRRYTTKPLALVAVQEDKLSPDLKEAIDMADSTKIEAVARIEEAKAEGKA